MHDVLMAACWTCLASGDHHSPTLPCTSKKHHCALVCEGPSDSEAALGKKIFRFSFCVIISNLALLNRVLQRGKKATKKPWGSTRSLAYVISWMLMCGIYVL